MAKLVEMKSDPNWLQSWESMEDQSYAAWHGLPYPMRWAASVEPAVRNDWPVFESYGCGWRLCD